MWQIKTHSGEDEAEFVTVSETTDDTVAWNAYNSAANKVRDGGAVILVRDGKINAEIRGSGLRKLW